MSKRNPSVFRKRNPSFRSRISVQPFELRVVIPLRWHWPTIFIIGLVVLIWLVVLPSLILTGQPNPDIFQEFAVLGIWLALSGVFLYLWLWIVAGKEVIRVDYMSLTVRREFFGFGFERVYEFRRARNLHYSSVPFRSKSWFEELLPVIMVELNGLLPMDSWWGNIAFDYEGQTHSFGMELDQAEALHLIKQIEKRRPQSYDPCRESSR